MIKYLLTGMIFLLSLGISTAQLNESDTSRFQLRTSLTGNYQQGNVEVLNIRSRIDFSSWVQKNWVFKTQNSSLYQAFYTHKADNDIFSRNYLYYKPRSAVYPFAIGYISGNFRRKINSRYFVGAGVTWQTVNTKNSVLKISVSSVYEATKFRATSYNYPEYNGDNNISLWRGTIYVAGWQYLLQRHMRLYYDAYWQPAIGQATNYRTQVDFGLDFPVWKGLAFNALYTWQYEQVVVVNVQQDDKILTFGLSYSFNAR